MSRCARPTSTSSPGRSPLHRAARGTDVRVAIAGAGNVGTYIAGDLREVGHDVLLIDRSPTLVNRLRSSLDVNWFVGDACEVSSLHAAGVEGSEVMVAATGDDEDNLVVSLLAKQEFAIPRVVAR